ncbi:MAG TPA: NF038120 family PEP-CTERM protein [Burkholderiaceae bacterium]|jgi:hypothetical protein
MKSILGSSLSSLFCAAALVSTGATHAAVLDFESVDTTHAPFAPILSDGDSVSQGAYYAQAFDPNNDTGEPNMALVGAMMNGADAGSCLDGACPTGNLSNYVGSVDDGVLQFGRLDHGVTALGGFDAAFLAPSGAGLGSGTVAFLAIQAQRQDGTSATGVFALGGPGTDGTAAFQTFQASQAQIISGTGTLTSGAAAYYAFAYYCDGSGDCSAFTSNKGQFALDNIALDVSAVPEPQQWLLMSLGLVGLSVRLNRRRSA